MADNTTYFTSRITGERISPATILSLQLAHLQEIVAEGNSQITDANIGSELRNILESTDIGFYQLLFELNQYGEQIFLRYATGNWLDEKAYEYGYTRGAGERASGNVTFYLSSPPSTDYTIYEGTTLLNKENGLTYILTDDVTFTPEDTSVTGFVIAADVGTKYNCPENTITTFDTEQTIRADCKVTNFSSFVNGEDVESDESLRTRILENLRGGNFGSISYYKGICEELENVHDVKFIDPIYLNQKYGDGRHTITVNGVTSVCNDCTAVCLVNCDTKEDNQDDTLSAVTKVLTNQENLILGHEFHVQDALKQKFYFKIRYYGENGATVSEDEVNACLQTFFYGGTYSGKITKYYDGYDIGETIYKNDIIDALENMTKIHHIESIQQLGWHKNMPTIPLVEKYYHDCGYPNMQYENILSYPDEDDAIWKAHPNSSVPHWKRIDANLDAGSGETIYQLEVQDFFFYKKKDNTHAQNNSGEYAITYNENENQYWLWGQKNFTSLVLDEDAIAMIGSLYELQPYLHNQTPNTHMFQLEKLG